MSVVKRSAETIRWAPISELVRSGLIVILFWTPLHLSAQIPSFPLSGGADRGCTTCYDTVKVLMIKKVFDLSLLLPEWNPVVDWQHVEACEGIVVPSSSSYVGTHVSQEDFSAYHYTHDFGFNIKPDSGYERLLAMRTFTGHEIDHPSDHADTILQSNVHVEWESGLASGNAGNPCAEANRRGESCGFFSAGHSRGETIWNWPTIGDWVHCEGVWIWDRGHPPAYAELHPLRVVATRRALGAYVPRVEGAQDSLYTTEIDIFASGDGGALYNNRPDRATFANTSHMSGRVYTFRVRPNEARPSPTAHLRWRTLPRPGDNFEGAFDVRQQGDALQFDIHWESQPDNAVFARTVYCWWEEPNGLAFQPPFHCYEVTFDQLHFNQRKDFGSRPEKVVWLEAGGQYLNLNEFVQGEDILRDGEAMTYRRDWNIGKSIRLYGTDGTEFRVHVGGWESDGMSLAFGNLLDPKMPCDKATKKAFHRHLWPATPFGLKGCLDDLIGEIHDFFKVGTLFEFQDYEVMSQGGENELEQCPGANTKQENVFRLKYSIRQLK